MLRRPARFWKKGASTLALLVLLPLVAWGQEEGQWLTLSGGFRAGNYPLAQGGQSALVVDLTHNEKDITNSLAQNLVVEVWRGRWALLGQVFRYKLEGQDENNQQEMTLDSLTLGAGYALYQGRDLHPRVLIRLGFGLAAGQSRIALASDLQNTSPSEQNAQVTSSLVEFFLLAHHIAGWGYRFSYFALQAQAGGEGLSASTNGAGALSLSYGF